MRSATKPYRVGLDFDNTLISYDEVFLAEARERGLIRPDFVGSKRAIRDEIRLLPDGDLLWQKLQGYVYGKGITAAKMFDGVDKFFERCAAEGVPIVIVSHKTEYGHFDPHRVNLRDAAKGWMADRGFFSSDGYGIPAENVYFESTREQKLARIADLACTHFVDDLEEVLSHPEFPVGVTAILFAAASTPQPTANYGVCSSWHEIEERVFRCR